MVENNCVEILLVEDNPDDLELALRALKRAQFSNHVYVARDGEEALQFIFQDSAFTERNKEHPLKIILLDLKLPKIDGFEVLKRLKENISTRNIPIVIFTSSQEPKDIIESYKLGVNSYVVKPVNFEQYFSIVSQLGTYWLTLNNAASSGK